MSGTVKAVLMVVAIMIGYARVSECGFVWDDDEYVTANMAVQSSDGLKRLWLGLETPQFYPLVFSSFWLEHRIWGLDPAGYHRVNVAIHAANALLLWLLLKRLAIRYAYAAALIWAVHPIQVETVAWITERKNLLYVFFYLLSFLCYLRYRVERRALIYGLSLFCYLASLFSKTVACTLPVVMLIAIRHREGILRRRDGIEIAPFFGIGLMMGLITVLLEKFHVGAVGADFALSPTDRILIAGRVIWFYAGKILWPFDLAFIYPRWSTDSSDLGSWIWPLTAVIALAAGWFAPGARARAAGAAFAAYVVTIFPALGFFDVYPFRFSFVANHFQYLGGAALVLVFVTLVGNFLERFGGRRFGAGLLTFVTSGLVALTAAEIPMYRDVESLWRLSLERNPTAALPHHNLGIHYALDGRYVEALEHLEKARRIRPLAGKTHFYIGKVLEDLGRPEEALGYYSEAAAREPVLFEAHHAAGKLHLMAGRTDSALHHFDAAIQLRGDPELLEYYRRLVFESGATSRSAGPVR